MRAFIRTLGIGAATAALIATTPIAQAGRGDDDDDDHGHGGHGRSDTSIDDISRVGFISRDGDTAFIRVTYTCPEDADAILRVSLEQEQDDDDHNGNGHRRGRGDDDTTTGSELVRHLECSDDSERETVDIDADGRDEWERGDAEAEALIVSWTDDRRGHRRYDRDFEREDVRLVSHRR